MAGVGSGPVMWSPAQYERFREARRRPFLDLVARVAPARPPLHVADLGCGTGDLTAELLARWPTARVDGVDASEAMLEKARAHARPGRLELHLGDLATWAPPAPLDVLVSNAALHWVPHQRHVLARLCGLLAPGGTLAVQVPANFEAPSHRRVAEVAALPRFAPHLAHALRGAAEPLLAYAEVLLEAGLEAVDAWETTYLHLLPGEDAVLAWLEGTTLRPLLAALPPGEVAPFRQALAERLRVDYPPRPWGTPLPFTRRFVVGVRPG